jgi:hypothetical protein
MSPEGVIAVACVLIAPGKSNEMTLPFPKTRAFVEKLVVWASEIVLNTVQKVKAARMLNLIKFSSIALD